MARIRSIHPGIYTDEAWASVSIVARWFAKGLCTEADDNGTFEWKPLQLKMRIFPADAVSVPDLLSELVAAGIVLQFQAEGKALGSLKNFCKYQRPRKPKAWFPATDESRIFAAVGSEGDATDADEASPVPQKSELTVVKDDPIPPKSEKSAQREDGGGRGEEQVSSEAKASSKTAAPKVAAAWSKDEPFSKAWDLCTPQMRKRSKGRDKTWPEWRKAAKAAGGGDKVLGSLAAYLRDDPDVKRTGGPGFHLWLADGTWDVWLTAPAAIVPQAWSGPPEIRARVVMEQSDDYARSYLDTAEWTDSGIRPRTRYAHEKLRVLRALKDVAILDPHEVAA